MTDTELLGEHVKACLRSLPGQSNWLWNQPLATYFAIKLAGNIAGSSARRRNLRVYASPHSSKTQDWLSADKASCWYSGEWLVDIVACRCESKTKEIPLLACESEVSGIHGVEYELNPDRGGYVWDFCKLLHFNAPELLFVARVNREKGRGLKGHGRLDQLQKTLIRCAEEYQQVWNANGKGARLRVVLLPTSNERGEVRLGVSDQHGALKFKNFGD